MKTLQGKVAETQKAAAEAQRAAESASGSASDASSKAEKARSEAEAAGAKAEYAKKAIRYAPWITIALLAVYHDCNGYGSRLNRLELERERRSSLPDRSDVAAVMAAAERSPEAALAVANAGNLVAWDLEHHGPLSQAMERARAAGTPVAGLSAEESRALVGGLDLLRTGELNLAALPAQFDPEKFFPALDKANAALGGKNPPVAPAANALREAMLAQAQHAEARGSGHKKFPAPAGHAARELAAQPYTGSPRRG